jgi:hypothetical protein
VDVVAVAVAMPRCLGPGKKQDASIKSVGFPAPKLWHSGLVLFWSAPLP